MRRIIVTGGCGFIGKHVVRALQEAGEEVTVFDLKNGGYRKQPWDGIVHLAAVSRASDGEADHARCLETNVVLTAKMLAEHCKWLILASTQEPATGSVYGLSKRFAEEYADMICRRRGIALRVMRLPVVYGEGDHPDKLLPRVFAHVATGAPLKLSDKALPINYVHVSRVVEEVLAAIPMLEQNKWPRTVSLRDGTIRTKRELMEFAEHVVHSDAQPA